MKNIKEIKIDENIDFNIDQNGIYIFDKTSCEEYGIDFDELKEVAEEKMDIIKLRGGGKVTKIITPEPMRHFIFKSIVTIWRLRRKIKEC